MTKAGKALAIAAAAAMMGTAFGGGALAQAEEIALAGGPGISKATARRLARKHFRKMGHTDPRRSAKTVRIGTAELVNGTWQVTVFYGGPNPHIKAIVMVNSRSGEVDQA